MTDTDTDTEPGATNGSRTPSPQSQLPGKLSPEGQDWCWAFGNQVVYKACLRAGMPQAAAAAVAFESTLRLAEWLASEPALLVRT